MGDLQHWPIEFTCPRLAPTAETLRPPCGNMRKQLGDKCSCCGFTALANQIQVSAPGAQCGNTTPAMRKCRNSLATSAHVEDLQHWPNKFTCLRLAPNAETLHPPCGNIQKQLGDKCSCCGFTALANQIHVSALGAQFGNNLKQAWKQGPCYRFLALADGNGPVPLSAPSS